MSRDPGPRRPASPSSPGPAAADPPGGVPSRAPTARLALGLTLSLLTIIGFSVYAAHEIGRLRDEQMALSDRHRRDSLQLIRIQGNLSMLGVTLRDMMERTEPYPLAAWTNTFERLQLDLTQALDLERTLAPARPPAQQQQVTDTAARFWAAIQRALALAAEGDEAAAIDTIRTTALPRHAELVSLVSQLLIRNTQVEDEAAAATRDVYTRVIRQIYWLMAILAAAVALAGILNIAATRRAFDEVRTLSAQLRGLTWRMLRLQEDVQTSTARELHDEFGQILTAMTMMLGRVRRNADNTAAPDAATLDARLIADLEEVQGIARDTLERIRTQSRLLHPVILDDFGLEQALGAYVDQFSRQHGIPATFASTGMTMGTSAVPGEAAIHLYRIAQEALSNVSRHAESPDAAVRLARTDTGITLEIEDHGRGLPEWRGSAAEPRGASWLPPRSVPSGIGITSMRERAELMGGTLTLVRGPTTGVIVRCQMPLPAAGGEQAAVR